MQLRSVCARLALLAGSCLGSAAFAQDSVSTGNGLPGDATSAYAAGATASNEQRNDYVVDLVEKASSWGNLYRFGPVMKGSSGGASYFTTLIGAQAASNRYSFTNLPRPSYLGWKTAGQGVSNSNNAAPVDDGTGRYGSIDTSTLMGQQFGVAFMEFGGGPNLTFGDGDDENNIIVGLVSFNNADPSRLYVSRTVAAVNKPSATAGLTSTASLGLGGVDEAGNVHILADNFGLVNGSAIADKRFIRVTAATRNTSVINQFTNSSYTDSAATRTLLGTTTTTLAVPTIVSSVAAGRPIMIGTDFSNNYQFEGALNTMSTSTAYLPSGGSPRGPISFSAQSFQQVSLTAGGQGIAAVLSRDSIATRTRGISVWGLKSNASVDGTLRAVLPVSNGQILDRADNFDPIATYGSGGNHEFTNFASQVSFRGGSGPVAMTVLPGGDLLLAATVSPNNTAPSQVPQGMDNYIAVARVAAGTGTVTWTIAAHTGNTSGAAGGTSKAVLGLSGGNLVTIGRVARYSEVFSGASSGPSISSPAMDRFGNVYFLSTIMLTPGGATTALVRANFDASTNAYQLEVLTQVGDVYAGRNSARNYQVQFLGPADNDSVDSGAVFSGSIVQDVNRHVPQTNIGYASPHALGALVFRAKIVYDRNADGQYLDPTVVGNTGQPDQGYNVAMVVMPSYNPVDYNLDLSVNPDDLGDFITAYFSNDPTVDFNDDGSINPDDLGDFITAYFTV